MSQREDFALMAVCLIVVLLSIAGIAAAVLTGLLPGLDGLLLLLTCLLMIAIFLPPLVTLVKQLGWLPSRAKKSVQTSEEGK
jgi:hypothetical protein